MFFNPAQAQMTMGSSPFYQQMMQQLGGGMPGMGQLPGAQTPGAPQLPVAHAQPGAAGGAPPLPNMGGAQPQSGFFGQMAQSPMNMASGLGSLSSIGKGVGSASDFLGSNLSSLFGGSAPGLLSFLGLM